jgi:hypothetical protein
MKQPGEYDIVHPIWQRGRDWGIHEERQRIIVELTKFGADLAEHNIPLGAKMMMAAIEVIEGRV